jgi:hypothetical protein
MHARANAQVVAIITTTTIMTINTMSKILRFNLSL